VRQKRAIGRNIPEKIGKRETARDERFLVLATGCSHDYDNRG
jgi:hypothetical protein